jgi:hypothetical protein
MDIPRIREGEEVLVGRGIGDFCSWELGTFGSMRKWVIVV